ncbi:MAG: rRNA maturation RNase YbeY [Spirochaetaceae bacterium]|jgi:probable rRNA maturation factor|nr:rRNA maturation RNase YbeY [Spirochaetaceae bacterium]
MNRIDISAEDGITKAPLEKAQKFIQEVLAKLQKTNWNVSVFFCSDGFIQKLNDRFRNKNEATDVLSFPLGSTVTEDNEEHFAAGDIVISLETLKVNSDYFKINEDEELCRLLLHGILHLDGMDHLTNNANEEMLIFQEQILMELRGTA